jgi:hypothetical protein
MHAQTPNPWYREPWPWLLMIMPLTAVIAGSITLWLAASTADGLVVGDYYKAGLAINQVIERDRWARQHGVRARIERAGDRLYLHLGADSPMAPRVVSARFVHPTHQGHDRTILFLPDAAAGIGTYSAAMPSLLDGKWHVQIEEPQGKWRLTGVVYTPFKGVATFGG